MPLTMPLTIPLTMPLTKPLCRFIAVTPTPADAEKGEAHGRCVPRQRPAVRKGVEEWRGTRRSGPELEPRDRYRRLPGGRQHS